MKISIDGVMIRENQVFCNNITIESNQKGVQLDDSLREEIENIDIDEFSYDCFEDFGDISDEILDMLVSDYTKMIASSDKSSHAIETILRIMVQELKEDDEIL